MTESQQVTRGRDAALVLDNESFKVAMQGMKDAVLQQLDDCPMRDHEGRLLLTQLRKLTFKFEGILVGMIDNAKIAQHKLDLDEVRNETRTRRMLRRVTG